MTARRVSLALISLTALFWGCARQQSGSPTAVEMPSVTDGSRVGATTAKRGGNGGGGAGGGSFDICVESTRSHPGAVTPSSTTIRPGTARPARASRS